MLNVLLIRGKNMKMKILFGLLLSFSFISYSSAVEQQDNSETTVSTVVKVMHDNAYLLAALANLVNLPRKLIINIPRALIRNKNQPVLVYAEKYSVASIEAIAIAVVFTLIEGTCIKYICEYFPSSYVKYSKHKLEQPA